MNDIQLFRYEGKQIRTKEYDGETWFVAKDLCDVLEIGNTSMALTRLPGHMKGVSTVDTLGGAQQVIIISESGMYKLAFTSRKEEAERFTDWVASDVLPSIHKHGLYATDNALEAMLSDPDTMIRTLTALKQERAQRIAAEATVRLQAPKVLFADSVAGSYGGILVRDMAKLLCQNGFDIGEKRFYTWLREHAYVIKNEGSDKNMPTQKSVELGVMDIREGTRINPEGVVKPLKTTLVTGKGQIYFINKFKELAAKGA